MTQVEELRDALEELMADKDSGPSDWATILVDQGWKRTVPAIATTKLEPGTPVEVLVRGNWVPGRVNSIGAGQLIEVDHERGAWSGYAKGSSIRLPQK